MPAPETEPRAFPWSDPRDGLPLATATAPGWARIALSNVDALLVDHAHCEQKAASSGLALLGRHPESPGLVRAMLALVHEELRHFRQVVDLLEARGGSLTPPRPDRYAGELRRLSCSLARGLGGLGDILVTAAFIEARSCERFRLLAEELAVTETEPLPPGLDPETGASLEGFYTRLADAEGRHWELFRDLAIGACGEPAVRRRLEVVAAAEAELVASLDPGPRIH